MEMENFLSTLLRSISLCSCLLDARHCYLPTCFIICCLFAFSMYSNTHPVLSVRMHFLWFVILHSLQLDTKQCSRDTRNPKWLLLSGFSGSNSVWHFAPVGIAGKITVVFRMTLASLPIISTKLSAHIWAWCACMKCKFISLAA